jgi:predicted ester cyclase
MTTSDARPASPQPTETAKDVVRRLVSAINQHDLRAIDELYTERLAGAARRWITPFLASFPDVHMEVVALVAEGEHVVGRFTCSGTHLGPWRGHPPTGRRFEGIDEVYIFRLVGGRVDEAWGIEDTLARLQQLGLAPD